MVKWYTSITINQLLGGETSKIFGIFTRIPGEMIQFDEHIFQMGWFNHQLINLACLGDGL